MTRAYATARRKPIKAVWDDLVRTYYWALHGHVEEMAALDRLTDRALAEDPDWVRGVVARELRRQARRAEDVPAPEDQRMARVAALRERGLSIREIAEHIGVGVATVHRDLKRWGEVRSVVTELPFQNGVPRGPVGPGLTSKSEASRNADLERGVANITPLRRTS